jgi:acetyl esterase/lipase
MAVTIVNPRLQARRGRSVTLAALTAPRTTCEIAVGYSPAPQLAPATANGAGAVSWRWTVSDKVRPGIYPIQVSCGGGAAGATITVS